MNRKNLIIGSAVVVFFSLLYSFKVFDGLGYRVYDVLLKVRAERERISDVIFLDVDDNAIAYNGVFPWPRSIPADGLLRLKEYGARAVIFDIEFIDHGPLGVDTNYLKNGLPADFGQSFTGINTRVSQLIDSIRANRIPSGDIDQYSWDLSVHIGGEHERLLARAENVARDNDKYLIDASALFGKSWSSLNLGDKIFSEEHAGRRFLAEELFSYPVNAAANANKGNYKEILPALRDLSRAAQGAGFTNVEIDSDGVRRRIDLAQNIHGHWYLQLAFAPLMHYLGNPELDLSRHRMFIKNAMMPDGETRNISIPLDGNGRMLLDWPKETYIESYDHISFGNFSLLDDIEAEMEYFTRLFNRADIEFFYRFDDSFASMHRIVRQLEGVFTEIRELRHAALENTSDEDFDAYVDTRSQSRQLMREIIDLQPAEKVLMLAEALAETNPGMAEMIYNEASFIATLAEYVQINLDKYEELSAEIEGKVRDRFAILGRSDTGTTDIGVNPFHGQYVNVGTHGVVLDMILSDIFLVPVAKQWRLLISMVLVLLFFIASAKFLPVPRSVLGFSVIIAFIAASALLFRYTGIFFNPLIACLTTASAVILREIVFFAGSEREKQFIRKAFSTYLSPSVVSELIADPSKLNLGGEKREMSVLFTDLKGFSTFSEGMDPALLVQMLNKYLTVMSNIIMENQGTIDKFIGDAIVAFFGAPIYREDHAALACRSALAMQKAEVELNKQLLAEGIISVPLFTRIGINTGEMVVGNMGSETKLNYTVMGHAVNLSSRLEGVNKQYQTDGILISEYTQAQAGPGFFSRKLDKVRVVGINTPIRLYELLYLESEMDETKRQQIDDWEKAISQLENRQFTNAALLFSKLNQQRPDDNVAGLYAKRSESYIHDSPPPDWDGVISLMEK
ncbi:MAG: CHASE2 domain-containing protein [Treponema sp.]|nr:CHASE2 domain-containing protein [Treponema sp.]